MVHTHTHFTHLPPAELELSRRHALFILFNLFCAACALARAACRNASVLLTGVDGSAPAPAPAPASSPTPSSATPAPAPKSAPKAAAEPSSAPAAVLSTEEEPAYFDGVTLMAE